jgi:hypothetical protein
MGQIQKVVNSVVKDKCSLSYKQQVGTFADLVLDMNNRSSDIIAKQSILVTDLLKSLAAASLVNVSLHRKLCVAQSEFQLWTCVLNFHGGYISISLLESFRGVVCPIS